MKIFILVLVKLFYLAMSIVYPVVFVILMGLLVTGSLDQVEILLFILAVAGVESLRGSLDS